MNAFVNEHQNDWDEHLPYISMAYRAAEHETTGITPNYMMLGREVTTPLDIQYCMPRSIAHIPQNRWASEFSVFAVIYTSPETRCFRTVPPDPYESHMESQI
jgi:hypothetical protein